MKGDRPNAAAFSATQGAHAKATGGDRRRDTLAGAQEGSLRAARPNAVAFSATQGAHAKATGGGDRAAD